MRNLVLIFAVAMIGQVGIAQQLDSTLGVYARELTREKVWLHLDKSSYLPGETAWFKAYVMEDLFPAQKSKTLYIDWIGSDGQVLHHSVSPLIEGTTNGQFQLPEDYDAGFVHVRAYTRWMLNFDTAFLYQKDIRVIQKNHVKANPVASLQLFPEGGDIVAGVSNRIAFKANDQWGRPVKIRGILKSGKAGFLDSLRVEHDGMGSFYLIPEAGLDYAVQWKDEKGKDHITALPGVKPAGVAMQLALKGTRRFVSLTRSETAPDHLRLLHLVGTMNGNKVFQTDITLAETSSAQRQIPTESLPSGILTLTLFDANWNAIAERISFINNQEYIFRPSMEVLYWGLGKRKRNEIEIRLPDDLQPASLSIAVTDIDIERDTSENIVSHFLLSSDIRGKVHDPAYYFSGNNEITQHHLDLVMMTHGWRRFDWDAIRDGILPKISHPRDTNYLALSGQVIGLSKGQLTGQEAMLLFIKPEDSATTTALVTINRDGSFVSPELVFFDTLSVYHSLKSKAFSSPEVRFMTQRLPAPNYKPFSRSFLPSHPLADTSGVAYHAQLASEAARLERIRKGKILETVTVTARQKSPMEVLEERYPRSPLFRGGDGYQFDLVNDPAAAAYVNIFNYLQGRVAGLQITPGPNPALTWRGGSPQLYLDEFQTDASMLNSIPINDVAYVKVFRPPFAGGFGGGGNGAIAIYTKRGDDIRTTKGGLSASKIFGYTPIREFYSPNYDSFDPRNEQPDMRTTIYWNPLLNTRPGQQTIRLRFYNNDVTKAFRVVIEGMTRDGLLTHFEQVME